MSTVIFVGFAIARLLGIALDGVPPSGIVHGMLIELVFGVLALYSFYRLGRQEA